MRNQTGNKQTAWSARKRTWPSRDCFLVLHLIDWEEGKKFVDQSESKVKNSKQSGVTSDTQMKIALKSWNTNVS